MAQNAVFHQAKSELDKRIGDMEINPDTICDVLRFAMEVVEATQLKGAEQKTLVLKLVRQVVVEAPISDEKEKLLLDLIDKGVLSGTVELSVMASKGEFDINKAIDIGKGCVATCCKLS